MKIKRNILLNPGPATTTDTVKLAQVVPDICPREPEFCAVMERVREKLVRVVHGDTRHAAVLFTASGTGGVEALISSVIPEKGKILVVNNGAYGQRMLDIARCYFPEERIINYEIPWTFLPDTRKIEYIFAENNDITHVCVVHHETTTGMLNPVKKIAAMAHAKGIEMVVDAVSSYAGIDIDIERDGFDYLVSTSNKNIQGMAGIAFIIAQKQKIEKSAANPMRNLYLNLAAQYDGFEKNGQMRFTPPVQTVYALDRALDEFFEETPEGRFSRYRKSWEVLTEGMIKLGFRPVLPGACQAGLLTAFYEPSDNRFSFSDMHDYLYKRGFTIYPGKIGGMDTFRIANIGAIDENDIRTFLGHLENWLKKKGLQSVSR